jgi:hypothetical protein
MAREITCPGCSQTFPVPEDLRERWVECPRCQGRVVNLSALRYIVAGWRACLGLALGLFAIFGFATSLMGIVSAAEYCLGEGPPVHGRNKLLGLALACFGPAPCAMLFLSGLLFFRADLQEAGKGARTAGAIAALLAAALLEILFTFLSHQLARY